MPFFGQSTDVLRIGEKRQSETIGGRCDKGGVPAGVLRPQAMVQVGDSQAYGNFTGEGMEYVKQGHGIRAAGYAHKNGIPRPEHLIFQNRLTDAIYRFFFNRMRFQDFRFCRVLQ